jgi:hypothetical protein
LGFPIRKSSDQSSVDSSPRLIAASYVLHRLLVPRHPPCALINLPQRCSRPLCSSQGTGGYSSTSFAYTSWCRSKGMRAEPSSTITALKAGLESPLPQDSTVCLRISTNERPRSTRLSRSTNGRRSLRSELVSVPPLSCPHETFARARAFWTSTFINA